MGLPKIVSLPSPSFRNCGPCDVCEARELSFCSALEAGEIHHLARILTTITAETGAVLYHEGDDAKHVYNVTAGCIKLYKMLFQEQQWLRKIKPKTGNMDTMKNTTL